MTKEELKTATAAAIEINLHFEVKEDILIVHSKVPTIAPCEYWDLEDFWQSEIMGYAMIAGRF